MEVKICQQTKNVVNSGLQTSIFETESINYEFIRYESLEQLKVLIKSRTGNENVTEYGIYYDTLHKTGYFLLMSFYDDNDYSYIICKNCIIYITNKGQTIDKIIVE